MLHLAQLTEGQQASQTFKGPRETLVSGSGTSSLDWQHRYTSVVILCCPTCQDDAPSEQGRPACGSSSVEQLTTSGLMCASTQVTQQAGQGTGHSQCLHTAFGEACLVKPGEESPSLPASEGTKGVAADTDSLITEFGEVKLVSPPESSGSRPTESGKIRLT